MPVSVQRRESAAFSNFRTSHLVSPINWTPAYSTVAGPFGTRDNNYGSAHSVYSTSFSGGGAYLFHLRIASNRSAKDFTYSTALSYEETIFSGVAAATGNFLSAVLIDSATYIRQTCL